MTLFLLIAINFDTAASVPSGNNVLWAAICLHLLPNAIHWPIENNWIFAMSLWVKIAKKSLTLRFKTIKILPVIPSKKKASFRMKKTPDFLKIFSPTMHIVKMMKKIMICDLVYLLKSLHQTCLPITVTLSLANGLCPNIWTLPSLHARGRYKRKFVYPEMHQSKPKVYHCNIAEKIAATQCLRITKIVSFELSRQFLISLVFQISEFLCKNTLNSLPLQYLSNETFMNYFQTLFKQLRKFAAIFHTVFPYG